LRNRTPNRVTLSLVSLQLGDVDLHHAHHRLLGACGACRIGIAKVSHQGARNDLPGKAELVLQPTAMLRRTAFEQPVPIVVDLRLIGTAQEKRHRLVELEMRAAVQPHEMLPLEFEARGEGLAIRAFLNVGDAGVAEDGGVETDGFLQLIVEPEKGRDPLHGYVSRGVATNQGRTGHARSDRRGSKKIKGGVGTFAPQASFAGRKNQGRISQ
jgi:hypothetical protein